MAAVTLTNGRRVVILPEYCFPAGSPNGWRLVARDARNLNFVADYGPCAAPADAESPKYCIGCRHWSLAGPALCPSHTKGD